MQNELQQWTAAYFSATDQGEPVIFSKIHGIIRNMQQEGKLKEIIFSQLFMIIQTLKVLNATKEDVFQARMKKLLALLFPDNDYLTKLVEQITSTITQTQQHVQSRGFQVQRPVRRGPPVGQSIC